MNATGNDNQFPAGVAGDLEKQAVMDLRELAARRVARGTQSSALGSGVPWESPLTSCPAKPRQSPEDHPPSMEDSDTGSEGGTPMGENCNDDESDGDGLSLEEIKHAMATINNHDDETQDDGDCELAELHRIMAEHNDKISASAILSQTLKCAQYNDCECGGAHICE